jgi:hypothetical protein
MPQARSGGGGSMSGSGARRSTRSSSGSRTSGRSTSRSTSSRSSSSKASSGRKTASRTSSAGTRARSTRAKSAGTADAGFEAAAQRVRKLNERIIEAGREAGEATLTSYERALKTIAGAIERGPGSSDVEWISNLATAQAKFIRDVTASWTSAARKMLK